MKMSNKVMVCSLALCCGLASGAERVIFDGTKAAMKFTKLQADPENAANMVAIYACPQKGYAITCQIKTGNDWTGFQALSFRMYSAEADGHGMAITCISDTNVTKGTDYFVKTIKFNWKGWKTFVVPFKSFGNARKPVGWKQISHLNFNFSGWGFKANPEAKYYLDDVKLISE
jgi:hypothetical protein